MPRAKQRNQSETRIPRSGRDLDGVVWGVFPPVISEPRSSHHFIARGFPFSFLASQRQFRPAASEPTTGRDSAWSTAGHDLRLQQVTWFPSPPLRSPLS
jgi:hypothetical protein